MLDSNYTKLIVQAIDSIAKYSWAVFITVAFIFFIPKHIAEQTDILAIRNNYRGIWFILLVFSGALSLKQLFCYLNQKFFSVWRNNQIKFRKENEQRLVILQKLSSLKPEERMLIKCYLVNNTPTLYARPDDSVVQSLIFKGILKKDSQFQYIFRPQLVHLNNNVWNYLINHGREFLSDEKREDPEFQQKLDVFCNGRYSMDKFLL